MINELSICVLLAMKLQQTKNGTVVKLKPGGVANECCNQSCTIKKLKQSYCKVAKNITSVSIILQSSQSSGNL